MPRLLAVLLIGWTATLATAADPPKDWTGQLVMLREDGLSIGVPDAGGTVKKLADLNANVVYRVLKDKDGFVWLREEDKEGWLDKDKVVLIDAAVDFFTGMVRQSPNTGKYYGRRATAFQTRGKNDAFIVLGETPRGELKPALDDLNQAVRLEPATAQWWGDRAWVHLRLKNWDDARDDATEAIRLEPKRGEWYFDRGMAWEGKIEHDIALKDYDEAIRLEPKVAEYWNARGGLLAAKKKEHEKAIKDYSEAIRLSPKGSVYYANRGSTYTTLKEYSQALEDLDEAIDLDPNWATPYHLRGDVRRYQKQWDDAIKDYTKAIELDPKGAAAIENRGWAYVGKKEYAKAENDFAEVIRLDPKSPDGYLARGKVRKRLQEYAKAEADYSAALKLDEKSTAVHNTLAWFYATCPQAKHRDGTKAVKLAAKAVELDGKSANNHDTLAAAHAEAGQFDLAVAAQEKAIGIMKAKKVDAEKIAKAEKRLALYRDKKPYRDEGD